MARRAHVLGKIYDSMYRSKITYVIDPKCLECENELEGNNLNFCDTCGTPFDEQKFTEKREQLKIEYEEDQKKLFLKFKKDVFEELGLSDHPKRENLYKFVLESYVDSPYNLKNILTELKLITRFLKFYDKLK